MSDERRIVIKQRGGLVRAVLLGVVLLGAGWLLAGAIPSLNPFHTETVDRSGPAVLKSNFCSWAVATSPRRGSGNRVATFADHCQNARDGLL